MYEVPTRPSNNSNACTHIRDLEKSLLSNYMGDIAQTLHRSLFEPFQIRYVFQYKDVSLHLIVVLQLNPYGFYLNMCLIYIDVGLYFYSN